MLKTIAAAFSEFTFIKIKNQGERLHYVLPLVGIIQGALLYLWFIVAEGWGLTNYMWGGGLTLIPVLYTAGTHLQDLYGLKRADSGEGSAAVTLVCYLVGYFALSCSLLRLEATVVILGCGAVLSRSAAALMIGLTSRREKKAGLVILAAIAVAAAILIVLEDKLWGLSILLPAAVWTAVFIKVAKGGVSKKLCGKYIQYLELIIAVGLFLSQTLYFTNRV